MKIGIFGDSYAANRIENDTKSWVDIIAEKYEVTNYASAGTSLFYSMSIFEQYQHRFDKVIFVVTSPGRLLLDNANNRSLSIAGLRDCETKIENTSNPFELKILHAVRDYYIYVQNYNFNKYVHRLMIEKIKRIRPDTVLIPASLEKFDDIFSGASMCDIELKENNAWGIGGIIDYRHCHMTAENNAIFATKVEEWLNGKPVQINLDDFVTPMNREFYLK